MFSLHHKTKYLLLVSPVFYAAKEIAAKIEKVSHSKIQFFHFEEILFLF